jgi:hypothetical protein
VVEIMEILFKDPNTKRKGRIAFSDFLKRKQEEMRLSDEMMAHRCIMPVAMWLGYKNGEIESPTQLILKQFADAFNMAFEDLRAIAEKRFW